MYTLFFYKNKVYKNVEPQITPIFKNFFQSLKLYRFKHVLKGLENKLILNKMFLCLFGIVLIPLYSANNTVKVGKNGITLHKNMSLKPKSYCF